uniref:Short-chain alcohol dehydrogenase like protein n=1 Tax=Desulfovibrio sp. U5L TaxID=596152 RepID=I2Q7L4_9BACT
MHALNIFCLDGRVAVITGGGGLLGSHHATAVAEAGGLPVIWDVDADNANRVAQGVRRDTGRECLAVAVDVAREEAVEQAMAETVRRAGPVEILINNAARNPQVGTAGAAWSRLENFPLEEWDRDIRVGLTGALVCSRRIGADMAARGRGVILNIASDLALIAPDQRIYRREGLAEADQPVKPVTYSVVKHGLLGLTRYLATYWAGQGVRVNALSPGGVRTDQPQAFVDKLATLIPMGRMAAPDEYKAAVLFLVSDASSYMTGANLSVDGGRTCW